MIALDEQALICDLAEVYHIYNYRSLPLKLVATLSAGLGDNSRIKIKARGERATMHEMLLAVIADRLGGISYQLSAGKGEIPPSLVEALSAAPSTKKTKKNIKSYRTGEEFAREWERLTNTKGGE